MGSILPALTARSQCSESSNVLPARADRPKILRRAPARDLKAEAARESRLGRESSDLTQRQLAEAIGAQPAHVARCEVSHQPHAINVLQVAGAPAHAREWARRLVRWMASEHGDHVMPLPRIEHGEDHATRIARMATECTDPVREYALMMADGQKSISELENVLTHVDEAFAVMSELRAYLVKSIEEERTRGES